MIALLGLLILLPFAVLADVLKLRRRWHAVPLQQRSISRATAGAFVLAACAVLTVHGVIGPMLAAGVAGFALLYLVVGIVGVRSPGRFDPMSAFWWALLVMIAGAVIAGTFMGFPP